MHATKIVYPRRRVTEGREKQVSELFSGRLVHRIAPATIFRSKDDEWMSDRESQRIGGTSHAIPDLGESFTAHFRPLGPLSSSRRYRDPGSTIHIFQMQRFRESGKSSRTIEIQRTRIILCLRTNDIHSVLLCIRNLCMTWPLVVIGWAVDYNYVIPYFTSRFPDESNRDAFIPVFPQC